MSSLRHQVLIKFYFAGNPLSSTTIEIIRSIEAHQANASNCGIFDRNTIIQSCYMTVRPSSEQSRLLFFSWKQHGQNKSMSQYISSLYFKSNWLNDKISNFVSLKKKSYSTHGLISWEWGDLYLICEVKV